MDGLDKIKLPKLNLGILIIVGTLSRLCEVLLSPLVSSNEFSLGKKIVAFTDLHSTS